MTFTVFYSWQSDIRAAACRSLIGSALEAAAGGLSADVEIAIDRDTQDVAGSPDITATIFSKIDAADALVADVTIIGAIAGQNGAGRLTPNPNVLVELGYALNALGSDRVILIQNLSMGRQEDLPFDLRHRRVLSYSSEPDAASRVDSRRGLQKKLEHALKAVISLPPQSAPDVELTVTHKRRPESNGKIHRYVLKTMLKNNGQKRIDDWGLELEFPTQLLDLKTDGLVVTARSDHECTLLRFAPTTSLPPGDEYLWEVRYMVSEDVFWHKTYLLNDSAAIVRASVDGRFVSEIRKPVVDLNNF